MSYFFRNPRQGNPWHDALGRWTDEEHDADGMPHSLGDPPPGVDRVQWDSAVNFTNMWAVRAILDDQFQNLDQFKKAYVRTAKAEFGHMYKSLYVDPRADQIWKDVKAGKTSKYFKHLTTPAVGAAGYGW